ncbi:MAG: hypothetical protein ACI8XD_002028, partial [Thermoproteota archaeon]
AFHRSAWTNVPACQDHRQVQLRQPQQQSQSVARKMRYPPSHQGRVRYYRYPNKIYSERRSRKP